MRIKMSSMVASDSIASIRRLGKEVKRLSEQQAEAMQRARFGGMTVREVNEYGARHRRIIQLLKQMAMLEKNAYEQQKQKKLPTKIAEERKFTMTRKGVSRWTFVQANPSRIAVNSLAAGCPSASGTPVLQSRAIAVLFKHEVPMSRKRKKLRGTVEKIIKPLSPSQPEKAQIGIHGADDLYREIRIENVVTDENGEKASLKPGSEVDVTVEADSSATIKKPA
jgi:hypothetical protein